MVPPGGGMKNAIPAKPVGTWRASECCSSAVAPGASPAAVAEAGATASAGPAADIQKLLAAADEAKVEGNELYSAKDYRGALECYAQALALAPDHADAAPSRATYHANSAACHLMLGAHEEAVKASTAALELKADHVKALMRRAQANEALDRQEEALTDYKKALEVDPGNRQAAAAARRLEPVVAEKREKLKEEMMGKLKDLGNMVLGNFGMSVDNFKAVKDPNTGSYSINFQS
eukprot:SM000362S13795  [mRNA]  locus=s362:44555:46139:- [translate_table: standard]